MLNIKKVNYKTGYIPGCDTCDYASEYIEDIEILFKDNMIIRIKTEQMYEYFLSEADYIRLLGNSDNINEFYKNFINELKENTVVYSHLEILINNKKIDIKKTRIKGQFVYMEENYE